MNNLNRLKKLIKKSKIISFDIFDTLILRPFVSPTDLFFYLETTMNKKGFAKKRIDTEEYLRTKVKNSEEITYEEIYQNMEEFMGMYNSELDAELQFTTANKEMLHIFNYAKILHKEIIIISDMYLPEQIIKKILDSKGFGEYKKLYLSSSIKKLKGTGNLFKHVIDDLKVEADSILHIGDNFGSDIIAARNCRIKTFYYEKVIDRFYHDRSYAQHFFSVKEYDFETSAMIMQLAKKNANAYISYWERFGYEIGGPICFSFVKWIINTIAKSSDPINDVFFVARDGYLLKKVFDKIYTGNKVESHYIYAPRILNLVSRLDYDINYFQSELMYNTIIDFYKEYLVFTQSEIENNQLLKIIKTNKTKLADLSKLEFKQFTDYLKKYITSKNTIFIVDTITDKFSSQKLISDATTNAIAGIYWCVLKNALQFDENVFFSYAKENSHGLLCWDIVEFILSSPENPIKTIKDGDPVYCNGNCFENKRKSIFSKIEKGVTSFIDDIQEKPFHLNYGMSNESLTNWINTFCKHPSRIDEKAFKNIYFTPDPLHSKLQILSPFGHTRGIVTIKHRVKRTLKKLLRPFYRLTIRIVRRILNEALNDRFNQVENRFNQVENRFNQVENRFNQEVQNTLSYIESQIQELRQDVLLLTYYPHVIHNLLPSEIPLGDQDIRRLFKYTTPQLINKMELQLLDYCLWQQTDIPFEQLDLAYRERFYWADKDKYVYFEKYIFFLFMHADLLGNLEQVFIGEEKNIENWTPITILRYISLCILISKENKALYLLNFYTEKYGLDFIEELLPVAAFAHKNGKSNTNIERSAIVHNEFEKNKNLFEETIKNKRVALVGNGPQEIGTGNGKKIDSYDVVIRMNEYSLAENLIPDYGSKVTIWAHCSIYLEGLTLRNRFTVFLNLFNSYTENKFYTVTSNIIYRKENIFISRIPMETVWSNIYNKTSLYCPSNGFSLCLLIKQINPYFSANDCFGFSFKDQDCPSEYKHADGKVFSDWVPHSLEKERIFLRKMFELD